MEEVKSHFISKVEQDWAQRGFSYAIWTDPPGQKWENYVHEVDELVMLLEGEVEFEIGGKIHHPQRGEELLIPSQVVHSVRNIGAGTSRWLYGYKSR